MSSCVMKGAENEKVGSGKVTLFVINNREIDLFALASIDSCKLIVLEGRKERRLVQKHTPRGSKPADRGCTYENPGSTSPAGTYLPRL